MRGKAICIEGFISKIFRKMLSRALARKIVSKL
jgi:hypothetical protein